MCSGWSGIRTSDSPTPLRRAEECGEISYVGIRHEGAAAFAASAYGKLVLMSGYLGSIGFGYPAALGAWVADPTRPVVAVTGDGGFAQYAMELTTAVKYGFGIKHVLLDNKSLGKISKEQLAGDYPVWHTSLHNPEWAEFARLCGATGIRVSDRSELDTAMKELFAANGPALLCVDQDAELL